MHVGLNDEQLDEMDCFKYIVPADLNRTPSQYSLICSSR